MPKIEIYTTRACPFCKMARDLLERRQAEYEEIAVDGDPEKMQEAMKRSGGKKTVPQIFIDGNSVGGYDELNALDRKGELERMLADNS